MNIEAICSILKKNAWCDMEVCGFHANDLIIKGCIDITDQNYFIELRFKNATYIDAPLSWTVDTTDDCIFKVTDKNTISKELPEFQKYFHLGGLYLFSFLAEFFSSKEWIHIVADAIEYELIN